MCRLCRILAFGKLHTFSLSSCYALLRNNWTPAMIEWTNFSCLHLCNGNPNLLCWQKDLKSSKVGHMTWYRSICRNSQWQCRYFPETQRGGRNCSEQLVIPEGAELPPCRKERWEGAFVSGLCELSCGVLVTFTPMLLPWQKFHGEGPQLEPDGCEGSIPHAKTTLAEWPPWQEGFAEQLCSGHAASMGPLSCLQHLIRHVCCWWWGGEGIYLIFEVCSLVIVLFLYCTLIGRHQDLKNRIFAKQCSRVAHETLFSSLFLAEPLLIPAALLHSVPAGPLYSTVTDKDRTFSPSKQYRLLKKIFVCLEVLLVLLKRLKWKRTNHFSSQVPKDCKENTQNLTWSPL